jgi:hypothetical protein
MVLSLYRLRGNFGMKLRVLVQTSLAVMTGIVLFSFQNCSSAVDHGSNVDVQTNKDTQLGGNGSGYDGKVFVARGPCGPNPNAAKDVLEVSVDGQKAQMLREECQKIDPRPIPVSDIQVASDDPDVLTYRGLNYSLSKRSKRNSKWLEFRRASAAESQAFKHTR